MSHFPIGSPLEKSLYL